MVGLYLLQHLVVGNQFLHQLRFIAKLYELTSSIDDRAIILFLLPGDFQQCPLGLENCLFLRQYQGEIIEVGSHKISESFGLRPLSKQNRIFIPEILILLFSVGAIERRDQVEEAEDRAVYL